MFQGHAVCQQTLNSEETSRFLNLKVMYRSENWRLSDIVVTVILPRQFWGPEPDSLPSPRGFQKHTFDGFGWQYFNQLFPVWRRIFSRLSPIWRRPCLINPFVPCHSCFCRFFYPRLLVSAQEAQHSGQIQLLNVKNVTTYSLVRREPDKIARDAVERMLNLDQSYNKSRFQNEFSVLHGAVVSACKSAYVLAVFFHLSTCLLSVEFWQM